MRITVAVVAVVVAVAGCSGSDPEPSPLPAVTTTTAPPPSATSSAPTPTPTPAPPSLPAAATADTPTGAESFARFWISALDYATTSGDTALIRRLADCAGCNALADGIDKLTTEGGRTTGGHARIDRSDTVRHVAGRAALVDLTYSREARVVIRASGATQPVPAEKNVRLLITLKRLSNSWQITNAQPAE